jgi:translation initiation factor 1
LTRLVWSTADGGQVRGCPGCKQDPCACRREAPAPAKGERWTTRCPPVALRLESGAKRAGKAVTVLDQLPYNTAYWKDALKTLKARCSCGGSWKEGVIELQGDHRDKVEAWLREQGFEVRRK